MERNRLLQILGVLVAISTFLFLFVACRPEPLAPQTARVLIVKPGPEATTGNSDITIDTFIENFSLVQSDGKAVGTMGNEVHFDKIPLKGHIIYYMDVTPPIEQGMSALSKEGTYAVSTEMSHTWSNVSQGKHTFWVQLVNQDNTPLQPPAAVRVYVTVK